MSKCRSCGGAILWARTPKGKMMPLNKEPSERGNVRVTGSQDDLHAQVYGTLEALSLREAGTLLHAPHYATCPSASDWRREKKR